MLKKATLFIIALMLVAGAVWGVQIVRAQEAEDAVTPSVPVPGGYGPGHMWQWSEDGAQPNGPGAHMMGGWMMDGDTLLDLSAGLLGMSVDELWAELAGGLALADLAQARGVEPQELIAAFTDAHATALQEAVDAGWMTQEQADWMQENMAARIEARVYQPWSGGFGPGNGVAPGSGRGFGPGGCHGFDGGGASESGLAPRGRGMRGGWGGGWQQPSAPQGPNA